MVRVDRLPPIAALLAKKRTASAYARQLFSRSADIESMKFLLSTILSGLLTLGCEYPTQGDPPMFQTRATPAGGLLGRDSNRGKLRVFGVESTNLVNLDEHLKKEGSLFVHLDSPPTA